LEEQRQYNPYLECSRTRGELKITFTLSGKMREGNKGSESLTASPGWEHWCIGQKTQLSKSYWYMARINSTGGGYAHKAIRMVTRSITDQAVLAHITSETTSERRYQTSDRYSTTQLWNLPRSTGIQASLSQEPVTGSMLTVKVCIPLIKSLSPKSLCYNLVTATLSSM
jgi:hypothetical protein